MNKKSDSLIFLRDCISNFATLRGWDQINTPKNLSMALCIEAAELMEPFQWLTTGSADELGDDGLLTISQEMADVLIYLVRMAEQLRIDLGDAVIKKLDLNALRFPET